MDTPWFREHIVLMFHSRSRDAPPGAGVGERIEPGDALERLAAIPHWRRLLSNFAESGFDLDGYRWLSVEHCFQAHKFKTLAPAYFESFTLASRSELSKKLGAAVKRAGGRRGYPLDERARAAWEQVKFDVQARALLAKFTQNAAHRAALLATGEAKLTHQPARSPRVIIEHGLMRVRHQLANNPDAR
jgi:ribA/ribD-fused uncharacterized protein